jgi:UDP-2,3-diacylglucosamine pyrophosphatase LpxH
MMLILNDLHLGVSRKAGTTHQSAEALRGYLFDSLNKVLCETDEEHLVVLGDLFDDFTVSARDWLEAYNILVQWCSEGKVVTFVAGNHDNSARGDKVSSFTMLSEVLLNTFSTRVWIRDIGQAGRINDDVYAIAHCANQDLFNIELNKALGLRMTHLLLHANYHNNFAVESDHSLNVSMEQAAEFANKGVTLVFAHVHQACEDLGGKVVVLGNQFPSSISDCLGNDAKYAHILKDGVLTKVKTWDRDQEGGFVEVDWANLSNTTVIGDGFVRVVGRATAAQASDVINAIAAFRQRSDAFVVSNGVHVEGIAEIGDLPASFEVAKAFDTLAFIRGELEPAEVEAVNKLLED